MLSDSFHKRNLLILFVAQMLGYINTPVLVFMLPLIGSQLIDQPALITLPSAMMVVGLALSVSPANMLMRRFGRKKGYLGGSVIIMLSGALGCFAVISKSFSLLCAASFIAGIAAAFVQSYRFAAVENAAANHAGRAIALILLGGVLGGSLGAPLANWLHGGIDGAPFAASWLALVATGGIAIVCFCFYQHRQVAVSSPKPAGSVGVWWQDTKLWAFALCGGGAYGMMTLLMTATPLSMHNHDGHSLSDTAWVIQSHVIAMFLPSFFSGRLIDRFGAVPVMLAGAAAFGGTALAAVSGVGVGNYWLALVLLGIGWNFVFVGATTLTARHISGPARFRAQAFNDVIVFSMQATAGLLSGALLAWLGWHDLNIYAMVALGVLAVFVFLLLRQGRRAGNYEVVTH